MTGERDTSLPVSESCVLNHGLDVAEARHATLLDQLGSQIDQPPTGSIEALLSWRDVEEGNDALL
jgi:hypothetical protein